MRRGRALVEGVRLTEPALGRLDPGTTGDAASCGRERVEDRARAVGRAIVHDDDLEVADSPARGASAPPASMSASSLRAGMTTETRGGRPAAARRAPPERGAGSSGALIGETDEAEMAARTTERDERAVDEAYESGTFCRASARYAEFGKSVMRRWYVARASAAAPVCS